MVTLLLAVLLSVQQVPLRITASVDRHEIRVGDEIVLTITVESVGNEPVQIPDPPLVGLEIISSSQRSDVSVQAGEFTRITTRSIQLAPIRQGVATIGPMRAEQGPHTVEASVMQVDVVGGSAIPSITLEPHIRDFVERQSPPTMVADEVKVQILTTKSSVVLGDQLDLVVLAWFPQEIRTKLRTPPTLQPPQLQGAWVYQQGSPGAAALSRRVGGVTYDLFAHHAVVFPLTAGDFEIGPATVSYSLPLTFSFLSREIRHEPQSEPITIRVVPQPAAGRPSQFGGTAATELELGLELMPRRIQLGGAGNVVVTLRGRGNVALWPEPTISWPEGVRVYPENVEVVLEPEGAEVAGVKHFNYMVVADSAGTHRIQSLTYPYFDLATSTYEELTLEPVDIVIEGGSMVRGESASRLIPLAEPAGRFSVQRLIGAFPWPVWLMLGVLPPLLIALSRLMPRIPQTRGSGLERASSDLNRAERGFRDALTVLVPGADSLDGRSLGSALRAAGVEEPVAQHAVKMRNRLWQATYGPHGEIDPEELAAEVDEVLRALKAHRSAVVRGAVEAGFSLAVLLTTGAVAVQGQTAERLYESGAYAAAVDSFRQRSALEPWSATHLQNMGASAYRLGQVADAMVAWTRAARLAPRSTELRDLLTLVPAPDPSSSALLWVSPLSPAELLATAFVLWLSGWAALVLARRRLTIPLLLAALGMASFAAYVDLRYSSPVGVVVQPDTPLRWAPYGPAPARTTLDQGSAVLITREESPWVLVERGVQTGWLMQSEIEPL